MRPWMTMAAAGTVGAAVAVAGDLLWKRGTAADVSRLLAETHGPGTDVFSPNELHGLPTPVARYFRFALEAGRTIPRRLRLSQEGEIRTGGPDGPWRRFTAVQHLTSGSPGFVWAARIRLAPLLTIQVRDSYIAGTGAGRVRIASLIGLPGQGGRPEMDSGALHRYLAEAVRYPAALLPSRGVVWEPVDGTTARATLKDGRTSVSLRFEFGERGEIVRASSQGRFREVKGKFVPTPWECSYGGYGRIGGVDIPLRGDMAWVLPEGRLSGVRLRLRAISGTEGTP